MKSSNVSWNVHVIRKYIHLSQVLNRKLLTDHKGHLEEIYEAHKIQFC